MSIDVLFTAIDVKIISLICVICMRVFQRKCP